LNPDDLEKILSKFINPKLAKDLVLEFIQIKNDYLTNTLGGGAPGKFIETVVQVLQYLDTGMYDKKPNVDDYLKNLESRPTSINDDLKICASRIARACYTLRNKRNISHKGDVDPNIYDLNFLFEGSKWILSELIRQCLKSDMSSAGKLIDFIQMPCSVLVEEIEGRKYIYGNLKISEEILLILHSEYPNSVNSEMIKNSLDRKSPSGISKALKKLWKEQSIHEKNHIYKLTKKGFKEAEGIITEASK